MTERARRARTVGVAVMVLALAGAVLMAGRSAAARVLPDSPAELRIADVREPVVSRDSAQVSAFLSAVRGANPVMCELASRVVDGQWGWGVHGEIGPAGSRDPQVRAILKWVMGDGRQLGDADVAALRTAISDPDACVRRMAAPLLGRIRTARALEVLTTALRDESPTTREMAALALGIGEPPGALQPLTAALRDASPGVRALAAWALGEIEDPSAIPALSALLRDDRDAEVRRMAAWALGEISG